MRISMKLLAAVSIAVLVFACDNNATGPDDLPLGIHGTVKDTNGSPLADVGVHLIFPLGTNARLYKDVSQPKIVFALQIIPQVYSLEQNYPNPFNPSTVIRFALPKADSAAVTVYDINHHEIKNLVGRILQAGFYSVQWDGTNNDGQHVTNGIYNYRLEAGEFSSEKQMLLDMLDPEHLRQINSIPLVSSDANGQFKLPYAQIPFGFNVPLTNETGPDLLGEFSISNVSIVLIKPGYEALMQSLDSDTTKTVRTDFKLVAR